MNPIRQLARGPLAAIEMTNIILTQDEAAVGTSPRDVALDSPKDHPVPLLLVFALINRPEIFDLRPGSSLIEFLLDEGSTSPWSIGEFPDDEDADMGLDSYIFDELHWAIRETLGHRERRGLRWSAGASGARCAPSMPRCIPIPTAQSHPAHHLRRHQRLALPEVGRT